ncbi:hypothetical protein LTSEALA_0511 [Salmonella enterica subsp. enterica serovar Alachua str. R6-377]|uniref:Uncharacterized protein n=1 Tax=Salmonella enterica subsp. enterica serovar Alachua str. R6-377 TaxID=913241 RepID=G5LJM6_SALET|nr:hypothetical protein LTSEALA_0511 [Salmonella enterica subsp. enterica serovar Alachua str. R6-377]
MHEPCAHQALLRAIKHTMGIKQRKVVIDAFLKTESGQLIGDLTGFNRALF